jgi:hypothetical protein
MNEMLLARKIVAASISGTIFAFLLGFILPDPFGTEHIGSFGEYVANALFLTYIYMMYSFPAILIYGVLTSFISDKIGSIISIKTGKEKAEIIISGALHFLFGLILLWFSLGAATLFFIIDRMLKKRKERYSFGVAFSSLSIPVLTFLLLLLFIRTYPI